MPYLIISNNLQQHTILIVHIKEKQPLIRKVMQQTEVRGHQKTSKSSQVLYYTLLFFPNVEDDEALATLIAFMFI